MTKFIKNLTIPEKVPIVMKNNGKKKINLFNWIKNSITIKKKLLKLIKTDELFFNLKNL